MRIPAIAMSASFLLLNLACGPASETHSEFDASHSGKTQLLDEEAIQEIAATQQFPAHPDPELTPGVRCQDPDEFRYPEEIKYCERRVSKSTKDRVIREYDKQLGYEVDHLNRNKFKIDHYIPLCMGGDNDQTNLWPQHEVLYLHTDPLEMQLCLALARGLITQNEAIDDIVSVKAHTDLAAGLLAEVKELLD